MALSAAFFILGLPGQGASGDALLREDGFYILREDGTRFLLE